MPLLTPLVLLYIVVVVMLLMGMAFFISGLIILVRRVDGRDLHQLSAQTIKLAESGMSKDISGLVGNAANLMDAMEKLTRTTRGIGVVLILIGIALFAGAAVLTYYSYQLSVGQGYV